MDSFSTLKTSIRDWLIREDLTDAQCETFIKLALARLNRVLRVAGMETEADVTLDARVVSLPAGFRGLRAIRIQGDSTYELRYYSPEQLDNLELSGTGLPRFFTIRGDNLVLDKTPDQSYTAKLHYYKAFPALSDANPTNWLTDNHPDLLLWAACLEAAKYIRDEEYIALMEGNLSRALDELHEADTFDKIGPAPVMRIEGPTY